MKVAPEAFFTSLRSHRPLAYSKILLVGKVVSKTRVAFLRCGGFMPFVDH